MSDDGLASNRDKVRNQLGHEFAQKASDAFCSFFGRPVTRGPGSTTVLELVDAPDDLQVPAGFSPPPDPEPEVEPPVRMRGPAPPPEEEEEPPLRRDDRVEEARLRSLASMDPVRAFLERNGGPIMRGGRGGGTAIAFDVCWLNHTVRARVRPSNAQRIAELADDPQVKRIDVTRALQREMHRSVRTMISSFRKEALTRAMEDAVRTRSLLTGRGVVVAVIDSEIYRQHPALQGRVFRRRRYTQERWRNPSLHGTAVAGVIAAAGEPRGMAPGAILFNYKVLGKTNTEDADDFDVAMALQAAVRDGARIANLSLGTTARPDGTSREVKACDKAWSLGLAIVKSAGNKGDALGTITSPGDADGVIVVGATDVGGIGVQHYSSRGPTENGRTRPDLVAPGGIDEIATITGLLPDGTLGCCGYGTTLAAAHVSGLLALMLEENPGLTPDQLRDQLFASCVPLKGDENVQGRGFPRWG